MSDVKKSIHLRSEELQDMLSDVPVWMVRWGSTLIFILLLAILFFSWLIKYPDTVEGEAIFTTIKEPVYLYSNTKGNLSNLYVQEGDLVREGQVLAAVNSTVREEQINYLQKKLQVINLLLEGKAEAVIFEEEELSFGEIQGSYNKLKENVIDLKHLQSKYYEESFERMEEKIKRHTELTLILNQKMSSAKRELLNAEHKYKIHLNLFEKGVISALDLMDKESNLNHQQIEMQNLNQALVQNHLSLTDLHVQLEDKRFTQEELRRKLKGSILSEKKIIEAFIKEWRQGNTITSTSEGKLVFIETFSEGYYVTPDKPIFALIPINEEVVAKVKVSSSKYGKIKVGQKVRLMLANYPFQEYGFLYGIIMHTSFIPINREYEVVVKLPERLISSYGQQIKYKPNMIGKAEVIIEDQRLLEKLFHSFRMLLNRR